MKNLCLIVFLSLSTLLNANQMAHILPLPCNECILMSPGGGILDVQQRTISLKDSATINSVLLIIVDGNGFKLAEIRLSKNGSITLKEADYPLPVKVSVKGSSNPQDKNLRVPSN